MASGGGKTPTSRYIGVRWDRRAGQWSVGMRLEGQYKHVGLFKDERAAAEQYDRFAKKHLHKPVFNFSVDGTVNLTRRSGRLWRSDERITRVRVAAGQAGSTAAKGQAAAAASGPSTPGIIKYKGVQRDRSGGWVARLYLPGRSRFMRDYVHMGTYATAEEAAHAYDRAARTYLVNPVLNYLDDGRLSPARHQGNNTILRPEVAGKLEEMTRKGATWGEFRRALKDMNKVGGAQAQKQAGSWSDDDSDCPSMEEEEEEEEEGEEDEDEEEDGDDGDDAMEEGSGSSDEEDDDEEGEEEEEEEEGGRGREVVDLTTDEGLHHAVKQEQQPGVAHLTPTTSPSATSAMPSGGSAASGAGVDVWVELKAAVFAKLVSMEGQSEEEARKYEALSSLLNKPTPSLRAFVKDVVARSFSAAVAGRAARLLADMAARGEFDV